MRKAYWRRSLKVVSLQPKEAPKRSLGLHSGALFGKVGQLFDEVEPTLFKMCLTRKLFLITLKWYSEQTVFKMCRVLHVKAFFFYDFCRYHFEEFGFMSCFRNVPNVRTSKHAVLNGCCFAVCGAHCMCEEAYSEALRAVPPIRVQICPSSKM